MNVVERAILVPIDTSRLSEKALPLATRLAKALDLPLQLFTVVDSAVAEAVTEFADSQGIDVRTSVDAYFDRLVRQLKDEGMDVSFHYEPGVHPADAILDFAEQHNTDMIVLASHGYSGITRWLLGSVAEKVVRTAPMPVMVVPVREE